MINILDIQPSQISKDLCKKFILIYGKPKCGKTHFLSKIPNCLICATEPGFNAINGAYVVPITKWSDFKTVIRQLKTEEAKAKFSCIGIDTGDILYDLCVKYICAQRDVSEIGQIPYGQGYALAQNEFASVLREIAEQGYGIAYTSHMSEKTFKTDKGEEVTQINPSLPNRAYAVINKMVDIIGYVDGEQERMLCVRETPKYWAGSRFKYMPSKIPFSYEAITQAISDAVDKQNAESGTTEASGVENAFYHVAPEVDFNKVMDEARDLWKELATDSESIEEIMNIIERIFGQRIKLSQALPSQVDLVMLVIDEMKDIQKKRG